MRIYSGSVGRFLVTFLTVIFSVIEATFPHFIVKEFLICSYFVATIDKVVNR